MCIREYVITFGQNHPHAQKYCLLYAADSNYVCRQARKLFGEKWSHYYASKKEAGVKEWNLKEESVVQPLVKILMYAEGYGKPPWRKNALPNNPWIDRLVDKYLAEGYLTKHPHGAGFPGELRLTQQGENLLKQLRGDFS